MKQNITSRIRLLENFEPLTSCVPDFSRETLIVPNSHVGLIPQNPRQAGCEFHSLLLRMADRDPLSDQERAYMPWLNAVRSFVCGLGVDEMDIEKPLNGINGLPNGVCDLLVHGGPQPTGVIEVKTLLNGSIVIPRLKDRAQVGAYARLAAANGSFDKLWAAVIYVEIANRRVQMLGYSRARSLIETSVSVLRQAA